ncbi:MAG TPA: hypothetical protein VMR52_05925 [Dehalococcoidia bacterium]|nr:hypothetical protein [Dehalococcoidia bacterium]
MTVRSYLPKATPEQEGIALIFTALAYGIVAILLVFQMLMRLTLIGMLIVISPGRGASLGAAADAGLVPLVGRPFPEHGVQQSTQVMVLSLGASLMVELTLGSLSNALLTLMLGIAVCWLTLRVLSLLRSRHGQPTAMASSSQKASPRVGGTQRSIS